MSGILDRLYPYQKEAVTATFYNNKGIVCLPTGVGKTFCEAAIIGNDIILNPDQFRIMLSMHRESCSPINFLRRFMDFLYQVG